MLLDLDQTLLPMANETAYTTALKKDGTVEDKGMRDEEDKQLHGCVNGFLQKMKDNLVNVRQDKAQGVAHYNTEKDVIYAAKEEISKEDESFEDVIADLEQSRRNH